MSTSKRNLTIGLALGSGAAHGWAHVGVLRALDEMDLKIGVMAGTSIGAVIAAAHLTEAVDDFLEFTRTMNVVGLMSYLDVTFSRGGLVAGERIFERFRNTRTNIDIAKLPIPFGAAATDLSDGREIWLREGDLLTALRASSAIPGLMPPVAVGEDWLVDGALVNPVPVSLCRAMGANFVIAVGLSMSRITLPPILAPGEEEPAGDIKLRSLPQKSRAWHERMGALFNESARSLGGAIFPAKHEFPSAVETLLGSIDVMQGRIMRSRLAGDPPEVLISPRLGRIAMLDFDKADELIEIGYRATIDMHPAIEHALTQQ